MVGPGRVFDIVGWLDAHHPCEGFHRLLLRIGLPEPYVCWESMRDLVPQVKAALGLPAADSYRVSLVSLSRMTSTEEPQYGAVSKTGGGCKSSDPGKAYLPPPPLRGVVSRCEALIDR